MDRHIYFLRFVKREGIIFQRFLELLFAKKGTRLLKSYSTFTRVELATFLAPVAYVDHMASPIAYIAPFAFAVDVSKLVIDMFGNISCNFYYKSTNYPQSLFGISICLS